MADEGSRTSVRVRMGLLVCGLWAVMTGLSFLFIRTVFDLAPEQQAPMAWVFWLSAGLACSISLVLVRQLLRPLDAFQAAQAGGQDVDPQVLDRAARSSGRLFGRLGLLGLAGPVFWLWTTGALLIPIAHMPWTQLGYFVALGLFDAMFCAAMLFFVPQIWLHDALERLAAHRTDALAGQGLSLKAKIVILGSMLATLPTLLVGAMSFHTADRLLERETSRALAERLVRVDRQAAELLAKGAGRLELERYLNRAAEDLGPGGFIHLGLRAGSFYRSEGAGSLSPRLYRQIQQRWTQHNAAETVEGSIRDLDSDRAYTYAFSPDGALVAIAPVQHPHARTTRTLWWMIVGITLFSMLVALGVGYTFADNLGRKIQGMAELTDEIAHGRLTRDVRVFGDDELGQLGASLHAMTDNLRRMVRGMTSLASQIMATCGQLMIKASAIATGADIQAHSVKETTGGIEQLNQNIQTATDSLQALAGSSREATEAAAKVGEGFNRMLVESDGLQHTIERTGLIVGRMVESVDEVVGHIRELSQGADRSAASMSQMDHSISAVTSSAADTARIAREAIEAAQEGAVAVRRTIEGMDRIVDSTRRASDVIVGLGNRVEDIGSILGVIEEIADQTNLLALNAAIIAAQAGEHGRSFAVVADEIRSLAERTASSTREIAQMIGDIQETSEQASAVMRGGVSIVNEGVSLAKQAGDSLSQILISVQKAASNVEEIAQNTEGQAQASELVTREIARVADMASRISRAAEEQAQGAGELKQAFAETLTTGQSLGAQLNQQAQENRLAMAAVATTDDAAGRANKAMRGQASISEGILQAFEQVREIAKNHADAASEMGEATKAMAEKSARLKDEIGEFQV